jgi:hypothetical protein
VLPNCTAITCSEIEFGAYSSRCNARVTNGTGKAEAER